MKRKNHKETFNEIVKQLYNPKLTKEEVDRLMQRLLYTMEHISPYKIPQDNKICKNPDD